MIATSSVKMPTYILFKTIAVKGPKALPHPPLGSQTLIAAIWVNGAHRYLIQHIVLKSPRTFTNPAIVVSYLKP